MATQLPPVYVNQEPNQDDPNAVSLGSAEPEDTAVSLPMPGMNQLPLPPEVAKERTNKTVQGLGKVIDKPQDQIYNDFIQGRENDLRREAASRLDVDKAIQRSELIKQYAIKKGGPLDPDEVRRLTDPFNPINTKTDPDIVVEKSQATDYVKSLNGFFPTDSILTKARADMPKQVDDTLDEGSELLTKNNYIRTRMQNARNLEEDQSYIGWGADFAKTMVQPYVEYKQRGLIAGALTGIGLGSNLDEAHEILYRLSTAEFKKKFDASMDYLEKDNPQLAVQFAAAMLGQDSFQSTTNNIFSAIAIPDYLAIGKLGKVIVGKGKQLSQIRKATGDMVDSAAREPNNTPATRAEGAGDLSEAAVQRITKQNVDALNGTGDPLAAARDTLLSTWYDDAKKFVSNPGTYLSREALTRIQDGFARDGDSLFNRVVTMNRPERTPEIVTDVNAIRAMKDKIKVDYKGPANTLADIEGPIREPVSGTYWYKSKIVNYDGTQFADEATAKGFAKQIGLEESAIKGQEAERVYIPATAAKSIESVKQTPNGTKFYMDHGVEVSATPHPQPGFVPYNLKTGKFESTLTDEGARTAQQGLGFHVEVWTPMRENNDFVRDFAVGQKDSTSIATSATGVKRIINSLTGWLRNSEDTLSANESRNRQAVTYTQSNIHKWADTLRKDLEDVFSGRVREDPVTGQPINAGTVQAKAWFGKLSNKEISSQFERTLDFARKVFDPDGRPGYFFKTPGELQDFYQRNWKRDPSYLETKAYFNFTKLVEGDRMMAEISEFRNRARLGTEQHSIVTYDKVSGDKITSPYFDGITIKTGLPKTEDQILVMGKFKGDETIHELSSLGTKRFKEMDKNIKQGSAKLIQIYNKDHEPLGNFSPLAKDQHIQYVYSESTQSKPLSFNHVERRGGGHFEWDYDWYLKQADIRPQHHQGLNDKRPGFRNIYVGDKTVMPIKSRALGDNVTKLWNEAHDLIRQNKWDEVKPIVARLGIKYDEFTSWYHPGRDAEGNPTRPMLNPHEPIMVVSKNKKISQMGDELQQRYNINGKNTFKDGTNSGPANNFKVAYNQERNSSFNNHTINDLGSEGNPIYAHQPADLVDPLTTMNRALNRAINSMFMDDYKIAAIEGWLREAEPYLEAKGGRNEIRSSPFSWFHNPQWRAGVDKTTIWGLESNRYKINSFVGTPNTFDTWMHSLTSTLADKFYLKYGPEDNRSFFGKAATIVPINMLHRVTDPVSWMRSVTFNAKLGLGAIPQFLVQAQTHALIWALEPRHGTVGTYQMMLHGWGKFTDNPAILAKLDEYATKMNIFGSKVRPGEFLEARRELDNSGFAHVAGEYANLDQQSYKLIRNDIDKVLKAGQAPFRLGEQSTRITAWYTAFREFREAFPTTPITNIERAKILQKADLLTVNMSRASSSLINHGVFSLSTQFLTYQIKLAELFWGKRTSMALGEGLDTRLSKAILGRESQTFNNNLARARIMTVFAALYGAPNALGVTGAPFTDNIKEHLFDDLGYIPGEKWTSTLVNEGFPAWQYAMIFGKLPNVGDRFGSQGFQNVKQALRGDIPMIQAIGGASVSTFSNILSSGLDPFYQYTMSRIKGDGQYKIKAADLAEPLKEISSYSTVAKWIGAINTGKLINKGEQNVTDIDPLNATIFAFTGMSPQEQDDMFIGNKMIKGEEDAKKKVMKEFIKDWRRGIEARANGDREQANDYHQNAMSRAAVVGMSIDEIGTAIAIGNRSMENAIDSSDWSIATKGDQTQRDQRIETFKRKSKVR